MTWKELIKEVEQWGEERLNKSVKFIEPHDPFKIYFVAPGSFMCDEPTSDEDGTILEPNEDVLVAL
jgi:hypothetical protein